MVCVGVAVGITLFFIVVIVTMVVIFAVIIYRIKRAPNSKHQSADIPTYNEQEGGYEAIPLPLSTLNMVPASHTTTATTVTQNGGEDEYMPMSADAPVLPDRTYSNKLTKSDNIYDNDDEMELIKKYNANESGELEGEKKCGLSKDMDYKTKEATPLDSKNKDGSGYLTIIPMTEESDVVKDDNSTHKTQSNNQ